MAIKRGLWFLFLTGTFGVLLLAGCATVPQFDLTETMELPGTGHTIDYPAGWYVVSMEPLRATVISEKETDLGSGMMQAAYVGSGVSTGYEIRMEIKERDFIVKRSMMYGPEDIDINDADSVRFILSFIVKHWLFETPADEDMRDVTIAEIPAVMAELKPPPSAALFYVALINDGSDVVLFRLIAPTTEDIDKFKPTWEKILQSIKPVG